MPNYGMLVALGIAAGAAVSWLLAPRLDVPREKAMEVLFWATVGGLVGARLLYVVVQWRSFADLCFSPGGGLPSGVACATDGDCGLGLHCHEGWCEPQRDCLAALKFWHGGWVFLGGIIGAVPAIFLAARRQRVDGTRSLVLITAGIPLGHLFGRVGCWFQGCCYGRPVDFNGAIDGRFPTQFFEAGGELLIFFALLTHFLRLTPARGNPPGRFALWSVPALYGTLYCPLRFFVELFRGDPERGFLVQSTWPWLARTAGFAVDEPVLLSTSQALVGLLFLAALGYWGAALLRALKSRRRPRTAPGGNSPAR